MSTLKIYADEAGTMPLNEKGGVFVTSAIAFFDRIPTRPVPRGPRNRQQFVDVLLGQGGLPSATMLVPYEGYGQDITDKFDQWDLMAQMTRETTGANSQYIPDADSGKPPVPRPNMVWVMYMQDVIHSVLVKAVLTGRRPVTSVEIILDQKTLSEGSKTLFCNQLLKMDERLRETFHKLPDQPELSRKFLDWVQFTSDNIQIKWEDEAGMECAADGLALADTLASRIHSDLKGRSKQTLIELMEQNGFQNVVTDRSRWAMSEVSGEAKKNWERYTGGKLIDVRQIHEMPSQLSLKPEYRQVRFRCSTSDLPPTFFIITAHNPDGATVDDEINERANHALQAQIAQAGHRHFPVTGGSPDFAHAEIGFGVTCTHDEALHLAHQFSQDAVFKVEDGNVLLISALDTSAVAEEIGLWAELLMVDD